MKRIAFLIFFIVLLTEENTFSQLEYAVIKDQSLYVYYPETEDNTETIRVINPKSKKKLITKLQGIRPLKKTTPWCKNKNDIIVTWVLPPYNRSDRWMALIQTAELDTMDFSKRQRLTEILVDSLTLKFGTRSKAIARIGLNQMERKNIRGLKPLLAWFKVFDKFLPGTKAYYPIRYDFIPATDSTYLFYIRNRKELSVWYFHYPKEQKIKSKDSDWKELVTYSIDTIPFVLGNRFFSMSRSSTNQLPIGKHHLYQSIQDTSFFIGNFKIIRQKQQTFCINTHLGNIYHIGKDSIVKVGHLNVKNYPRWLLSKPLFIEDRDSEKIIFLAEVKRTNFDFPFPDVEVLGERDAVYERFRF